MHILRKLWSKHSLSLVAAGLLALWSVSYIYADPGSHWGAFCGNAIADWLGSLVLILGTKCLYESGSAESRPPPAAKHRSWGVTLLKRHSLLIFLVMTGAGWLMLFMHLHPESKVGQVSASIVSEWVQVAGLVFFTKRLVERGSEESR